jgi:hypothetical protein
VRQIPAFLAKCCCNAQVARGCERLELSVLTAKPNVGLRTKQHNLKLTRLMVANGMDPYKTIAVAHLSRNWIYSADPAELAAVSCS